MRDDTKRELERLERKLLQQEDQQTDDELLEDLKEILGEEPVVEPAFDDPQTIHTPKEPMVYTNFANDYGRVPAEEVPEAEEAGFFAEEEVPFAALSREACVTPVILAICFN